VSLAAEAWLEHLHMHFGTILAQALKPISQAERRMRAAEKADDELRRLCAPAVPAAMRWWLVMLPCQRSVCRTAPR
jgi:hypothetical protein